MHVDIIDSFETLTQLKTNWDAVYDADPEAHYFLSSTWISGWFENLNSQWLVLAAKPRAEASGYVGFFPVQLRTETGQDGRLYNSIRMGGSYFAVYTGFICDPAFQDRAIPALATCLKSLNWTNLHFDDVYASDERRQLFFSQFTEAEFFTRKMRRPAHVTDTGEDIDHDIYIYVRLPGDFETYLNTRLGTNTRRDARYFLRKVDGTGEYRITHADASTIERDLETLLRFWLAQWEEKSPKYAHSMVHNSRKMLKRCFEAGALFLPVLWKGDAPIGAHVGFVDKSKRALVCFLVGRDLTVKKPPPGFVLHMHSMKWAIENGLETYDLGTGNFSYKSSFGSEEHRVERWCISTLTRENLRGKLEPRSLPAVLSYVRALHKAGKFPEAARGCRQILAVEPGHAGARALLEELDAATASTHDDFAKAFAFHKRGQTADAEQIYRSILAREPDYFDARHLLGVVFLERGEFEAAEREISLAIKINPNVAPAHNNRGNALKGLGRLEEALASYERAIALNPDYPLALNNRGNALRALGRTGEALASYDQALALKPDYVVARNNRELTLKDIERRA
jgi:Flp pilus assembly protein TadD